ncbi:importin-13-like [Branchiostoma floridae x Branchiostoma belcheri]
MKVEGFPSGLVTAQQKEQFARNVLKERVNKRKMKETVKEFSLLCRGLYGTEYAAETEFSLNFFS